MVRRCAVGVFVAALLVTGSAAANGRFPAANQLVVTPGAPQRLVLRATFGVLVSDDRGAHWDWVCERGIGYGGDWDPPIAVFANGTIMAGTIDGLSVSPDHGCRWGYVQADLAKRTIIDVSIRPENPHAGIVLASTNVGSNDAGNAVLRTELFGSTDDGASFSLVTNAFDPVFVAQTVDTARSDPKRIYVSGSISEKGVLYVASDGGASFVLREVPLEKPAERRPFIAAIDPTNADRVYMRTSGASSRLLVTDDAGQNVRSVFSGPPLVGFALSADGSRVWVGHAEGLFTAKTTDFAFEKISDLAIQCLMAEGDTLYACVSDPRASYILGSSTDGGHTFHAVVGLSDIRGPIKCADGTEGAQCAPDWPALEAVINPQGTNRSDAGPISANRPKGQPALGAYGMTGGCAIAPSTTAFGALATALATVATAVWRRRRLRLRTRPFPGSR